MLDFGQLLPHCKKDSKLDTKTDRMVINEVADMKVGPLVCFDVLPACWLVLCTSYRQLCQQAHTCAAPSYPICAVGMFKRGVL